MVAFWDIRRVAGEITEIAGIGIDDKKRIIREVYFSAVCPPADRVFEIENELRKVYDLKVLFGFKGKKRQAGNLLSYVLQSYSVNYVLNVGDFLGFLKNNEEQFLKKFPEDGEPAIKVRELSAPLCDVSSEDYSLFNSLVSKIRFSTETQGGLVVFKDPKFINDSSLFQAFRMVLSYVRNPEREEKSYSCGYLY